MESIHVVTEVFEGPKKSRIKKEETQNMINNNFKCSIYQELKDSCAVLYTGCNK